MFGTKKKLLAAVVMLVISAIMMTSASYAWFTISTNPEISGLTTQVVVNENLEIALATIDGTSTSEPADSTANDSGNQFTWGNIVDLNAVSAYTSTSFNKTLRPMQLDNDGFKKPFYGSDGRIDDMEGGLKHTNYGLGNLTYTLGSDTDVYAYYVDFWVRSNVGGNLVLQTDAVNRETGSTPTGGAQGSIFKASGETTADAALTTGIQIAFQDITGKNSNPAAISVGGTAAGISSSSTYEKKFKTDTAIVNLGVNTPALIRMYIYLDGSSITNASASTLLDSVKNITGTLNVQFKLQDKELTSMNEQP